MNREYHKRWSECLQRDMELLVFGHTGAKVLVFPTRDGRFYEYENLGIVEALKDKIQQGYIQLYCIDSLYRESFYCSNISPVERIQRHITFEKYVIEEVLPFMNSKNSHECTIAHGLSLGAFHAAAIAFRHPNLFKKLVALSGRYDLTLSVECFTDLLEGFYSEDVYNHTPSHFLPHVHCEHHLEHLKAMEIIIVIGREDPFLENNYQLSDILHRKDIAHQFFIWDGRAHNGHYWRRMAPFYL
jgi:esterase/lipase superfamily enzyme